MCRMTPKDKVWVIALKSHAAHSNAASFRANEAILAERSVIREGVSVEEDKMRWPSSIFRLNT